MIYVRDESGTAVEIKQDNVNHPKHYELPNGIEVFDVIAGAMSEEAVKGFCIGNVIKYVCRHDRKNGVEDLRKAKWYLDRYLEEIEKNKKIQKGYLHFFFYSVYYSYRER